MHVGQHFSVGADHLVWTVLPDGALLTLDELLYRYRSARDTLHDIDDLGPEWPEIIRSQEAGETAEMFLDAYVPFAEDGAGDFEYIDTRPGGHHGFVRYFMSEAADGASLYVYVAEIRAPLRGRPVRRTSIEAPREQIGRIADLRIDVLVDAPVRGRQTHPAPPARS
ncbi:SMI1/KNR4 family protein [Rhodococcus sp. BP-241]|nr:SMI1/KNR4 family protein [Rhodococcus sp. BP-241]